MMTPEQRHIFRTLTEAFEGRHPDARERVATAIERHNAMAESLDAAAKLRRLRGVDARLAERHVREHRAMVSALRRLSGVYKHTRLRHLQAVKGSPGPTAETLAHRRYRTDPLTLMCRRGQIDAEQLDNAREIAAIYNYITAGRGMAMMDLERTRGGGGDFGEGWALLHALVYVPWCEEIAGGVTLFDGHTEGGARRYTRVEPALPIVMAMIVEGEGKAVLTRRHRVRWITIKRTVAAALEAYGRIRDRRDPELPEALQRAS